VLFFFDYIVRGKYYLTWSLKSLKRSGKSDYTEVIQVKIALPLKQIDRFICFSYFFLNKQRLEASSIRAKTYNVENKKNDLIK